MLNGQKPKNDNRAKDLRVGENLGFYSSISRAIKEEVTYDVRYEGQSVATLKLKDECLYLEPNTGKNRKTYKEYPDKFNKRELEWGSSEAEEFIKYFSGSLERIDGATNKESKIESKFLKQFNKKSSEGKVLLYIQPVTLSGVFFQMPTPLKASSAKDSLISYADYHGGGIDILARQGIGQYGVKLTVIEVKDKNTRSERPEKAIKQAIAYATFIQKLLRSERAGNREWWDFFGFNGAIPNQLIIKTVIAMPYKKYNDEWFARETLNIPYLNDKNEEVNDKLELHYIFFDVNKEDGEICNVKTSLPGQE